MSLPVFKDHGIVYTKSFKDEKATTIWVKRDYDTGYDIRIHQCSTKGEFVLGRTPISLYSKDEMLKRGHFAIEEDEFNNAYIEAYSWFMHNMPATWLTSMEKFEKQRRPRRPKETPA